MADEADSKSVVGNHVWVQVPLTVLAGIAQLGERQEKAKNVI
mgnify:CR=1 FL=1